jgi:hypothetical protein
MTGFIVCVFPFRNRVSPKEAFEGLELGEGKPSRPVLRGPGGRKTAWLLGSYQFARRVSTDNASRQCLISRRDADLWVVIVCSPAFLNRRSSVGCRASKEDEILIWIRDYKGSCTPWLLLTNRSII